jgi:hypothetical protein
MSAILSPCNTYRYRLNRDGDPGPYGPALFLMLNPSTADAELDDPTIRRCRGFARTWGNSGIVVANLYALRSTDPAGLWSHPDPVGPDNDAHLAAQMTLYPNVVCAWGANARPDRIAAFRALLLDHPDVHLFCLGITKSGAPRHPLYVRGDQPLIPFTLPR